MARRRRRHAEAAHDNEERWLLTYSDLITLLFVLFVVMYAISTTDVRKFIELAQSVSAAFNADVMQGQQANSVLNGNPEAIQQQYEQGSTAVETDMRAIKAALQDYALGQGLGSEVEVGMAPQGIVIRLNDALLFTSGRAHLDDHALALVSKIVAIIRPLPNNIRIEGNTDDQPPEGGLYADNWELSTARALAVLEAMVNEGLPPQRLAAQGNAQYDPVVPNADDASRARNRRVDIVVLYPGNDMTGATATSPISLPSFP
jgi:chemotaxis protein MotB